ncbi:MAG: PBSX family phage terminase large subunit [Bacteroidetes bacterium]|nr:PBSX family phage terminase large subunit [Bacteroidota bacterium]
MTIDLEKQVLPVYRDFFYDKSYFSIIWGSRGSGKTRAVAQKIMFRALSERNHLFVVIRNKMIDHANSTYRELKTVADQWGVYSQCDFMRAPLSIRLPENNCEILFLGLDDPQRLKGLSGVTGLWFEEVSEVDKMESFDEVMSGFRPDRGLYEQVIMTFNPISKDHWLKKRFFDENPDESRTYKIHTTWQDNPFLNRNTVQTYLNLRFTNERLYRVNTLGEWGSENDEKQFYKMFRYSQHVDTEGKCVYNPEKTLHVSWDFNLQPGMTMVMFQVYGREVRVIDEMLAESPHNTVYGACQLFMAKYPDHQDGLYIYADPAGKERSQVVHSNQSNIERIAYDLADYHPVFNLHKAHPRVPIRGQWINLILSQHYDIKVLINPKCKNLISDFAEVQEDAEGKKVKEMTRTKTASYQRNGHASDAFDYFITYYFKKEWEKFSKPRNGLTNMQVVQRLPLKYGY